MQFIKNNLIILIILIIQNGCINNISFEEWKDKIVRIETKINNPKNSEKYEIVIGTGFFLNKKDTIITDYHVLAYDLKSDMISKDIIYYSEITGFEKYVKKSEKKELKLHKYDRELDLAVLFSDMSLWDRTDIKLKNIEKEYTIGENVYIYSIFDKSFTKGKIYKILNNNQFASTNKIRRGMSGSPVLNKHGKCIGIVQKIYPNGNSINLNGSEMIKFLSSSYKNK